MRLSTKARYAIIAMMQLALNDGRGPMTLAEISQAQGVSLSYLEQLFAKLRKYGLVKGVRGPGGGYRLARHAESISMAQIIDAIDDRTAAERQRMFAPYLKGRRGRANDMWTDFSERLYRFLEEVSLAEFLHEEEKGGRAGKAEQAMRALGTY